MTVLDIVEEVVDKNIGSPSIVSPQAINSMAMLCWLRSNVSVGPERMQGVNWFGFETSATMVAGLWAGSSSLTQDFKTVVWRFKLLGFNAVRLPFSFKASTCLLPYAVHFHCFVCIHWSASPRAVHLPPCA